MSNEKSLKDIVREEYKKCVLSPTYFIKKYCVIQHPKKGKMPFELYKFQEDCIQDFQDNDRIIILKSRQLGISTTVAAYTLWLILFHSDKNCLAVAIDQLTSKNLITKIHVMYEHLPTWLKIRTTESNKLSMRLANGSQVKAVASTGTTGRSEALSLVIMDEAAFIDNAETLWASLQQTLSTGGKAIILSTPNGTENFFHSTWVKSELGENKFKTQRLPWQVHPDRNQAWRELQDTELGTRLAAQECDCDFTTSGNTVITPDILAYYKNTYVTDPVEKRGFDGNLWIWEPPDYSKNYLISADVARGDGMDNSAFHVMDVETCKQVAEYKSQLSTKDFGNLLVAVGTDYNDALLSIENANIGWATIEQVINRNYRNLFYSHKSDLLDSDKYLLKGYDVANKVDMIAGFTVSMKTRPLMISKMEHMLREKEVVIQSKRMLDELAVFRWKNGRAEAAAGYNDDLVMSYCQGLWVRDIALRLRQAGMYMNKLALNNTTSTLAMHKTGYKNNSWKTKNQYGLEEDLTWLI